jgi:hypothetical protein
VRHPAWCIAGEINHREATPKARTRLKDRCPNKSGRVKPC